MCVAETSSALRGWPLSVCLLNEGGVQEGTEQFFFCKEGNVAINLGTFILILSPPRRRTELKGLTSGYVLHFPDYQPPFLDGVKKPPIHLAAICTALNTRNCNVLEAVSQEE